MKRLLSFLLLILGVAVLIYFVKSLDLTLIRDGLSHLSLVLILFLVFLVFLTVGIKALRWKYLIQKTTGRKISGWFSFFSIIAGIAAGSLTPSRAGEVAKPFQLKTRYDIPISETVGCVFSERAFDLLSIILLFFLSLLFLPLARKAYASVIIFFVGLLLFIVLFLFVFPQKFKRGGDFLLKHFSPKKWKEKLLSLNEKVFAGFEVLKKREVIFVVGLTSFLSMFIEVVRFALLLKVLGLEINFWLVMLAFAGSVVFGLVTLVPGGIGTTEISLAAIVMQIMPHFGGEPLLKLGILIDRFLAFYLLIGIGGIVLLVTQKWKD